MYRLIMAFALGGLLVAGGSLAHPAIAVAPLSSCDSSRGAVRVLADQDAPDLNLFPLVERVIDLNAWPAPAFLSDDARAGGVETHTYDVTSNLLGASMAPNGDIRLILQDPFFLSSTIVAVLPNLGGCTLPVDPFYVYDMTRARSSFLSLFDVPPSGAVQPLSAIVRVIGAGFYNPETDGPASAANGLELSPVLDFTLVGPALLPSTFPGAPPAAGTGQSALPPLTVPGSGAAGRPTPAAGGGPSTPPGPAGPTTVQAPRGPTRVQAPSVPALPR